MPPDKHQDLKPRTKSTDNVRVIEMRKERSRNAARNRRGKENAQFDELAKLLPLPAAITSQLDKASIIRLTISYLNMREFSGAVPKMQLQLTDGSELNLSPSEETSDVPSSPQPSTSREVVHYNNRSSTSPGIPDILSETGSQLLQALEGFLMVLSIEGKILYVSETVSVNLGLSQVELTGNSVFNYIHQEDHPDVLEQLTSGSTEDLTEENQFQGEEIGPAKILPHQPRSFFLRMKCTLVRRGGSYAKSAGFKVVHCVGRVKEYAADKNEAPRRAFVLLAQPVPTMNINELPLECNMFVSRVNMDLKIVYCEGRIHRFMDYLAKDIVGISAYDFYHAGDVALIQGHHAKFLSKGQVWTKYYRWMNKNGGWVWMQTKASLIPHPSNPALKQMLCLNYILSDVEHRSVVLGMAQLDSKPELTSAPSNILTEVPCDGDSTGELNDALIDDQVMVFPKWQATSDKLVPQQTLLDQMALQRTGYTQQFNEAFKNWTTEHPAIDRKASQSDESHDPDFDEKELQDIADIINADVTPFDQSLFDFVVSGFTPSTTNVPSSQLNPIGGYIEEIPTTYASTSSVVPKVEKNSVTSDFGSTMSCAQGRKRPAAANSFDYDGNSVDSSVLSKAPRLTHMEGTTANTNRQYQDNTWKAPSSTSTTYSTSGRYMGTSQLPQTSTTTNQSTSFNQGAHNMGQNAGPGLITLQKTVFSNRKPKSLLEQLVMMPNSGKEDDILDDDLMLELVEELMERGTEVDMDNVTSVQDNTVGSSSRSSNFVPFQNIKQEVVTPTTPSAPAPFSECIQNIPKQPMKGLYQSSTNDDLQSDSTSQRNVNMQDGGSLMNLQTSTQQQQWTQPQRLQHPWQQQQQQGNMPQQYQIPNNQTKQPSSQQLQQQPNQQSRTSYSYTGSAQQQRQLQQQRTPELQSIAEQSQIFRELNELIKQNNRMNAQNIANQRVLISSAPLPELSNVIDEELNSLPMGSQTNSLNSQNFNGTGNRNFTGM